MVVAWAALIAAIICLSAEPAATEKTCLDPAPRTSCLPGFVSTTVSRTDDAVVGDDWVQRAVAAGVPAIFSHSETSGWPALTTHRWTPELLAGSVHGTLEARTLGGDIGDLRVHTIRSDSRSGETLRVPGEAASAIVHRNVTARELFFGEASGGSGGRHAYWSGPLESLGPELAAHVSPRPHLERVDARITADPSLDPNHLRSESVIWMGRRGTVAQTHHDRSNNLFSQIVGRKRFVLYPPSAHWDLRMYPVTHPSRRQSQRPVSSAASLEGDGGDGATCFVADLRPGDVLFVPPFWAHSVESVDDAASLSVVTPGAAEYLFSRIYWSALPLKPLKSAAELATGMLVLLSALLETLLPRLHAPYSSDAALFVGRLKRTRYDSLEPGLPEQGGAGGAEALELLSPAEEAELRVWFEPKVMRLASEALGVLDDGLSEFLAEAEILLCDYVEELARYAVGAARVPLLLGELERRLLKKDAYA